MADLQEGHLVAYASKIANQTDCLSCWGVPGNVRHVSIMHWLRGTSATVAHQWIVA